MRSDARKRNSGTLADEVQLCTCRKYEDPARCLRHVEVVERKIGEAVQAERERIYRAIESAGHRKRESAGEPYGYPVHLAYLEAADIALGGEDL